MRYLRFLGLLALLGIGLFSASRANAQKLVVGVGVGGYVGPASACAYGYYDYYPYACAPYGYYGPDWFVGGVFIGAGPWYHRYYGRPDRFYGHRYGYYGRGPGAVYHGHGQYYSQRGGYYHGSYRGGDFHRGFDHGDRGHGNA